MIFFNNISV